MNNNTTPKPINIDEYIQAFPTEIQTKLASMRNIIKAVAPNAIETMSYGMPTFKLKHNLVHFAVFKNHIGFYPNPSATEKFNEDLKAYKTSKGAIQFPIQASLPLDLIRKIVEFRVKELSSS